MGGDCLGIVLVGQLPLDLNTDPGVSLMIQLWIRWTCLLCTFTCAAILLYPPSLDSPT